MNIHQTELGKGYMPIEHVKHNQVCEDVRKATGSSGVVILLFDGPEGDGIISTCTGKQAMRVLPLIRTFVDAMIEKAEENACPKCRGCGRVANTKRQEPWTAWENLPLISSASVLLGIVKPITCPECGGKKQG